MPTFIFERRYGHHEGKIVCGTDEAGRGPLAGPVVAAAVILPHRLSSRMRAEIRDSKKMTASEREALFDPLHELCSVSVAEASVGEIESLNILWASMLAMKRAIEGLNRSLDMVLVDGNRCPDIPFSSIALVAGDDRSLSIAAASIVAKVTRDRAMARLAECHPGYGWEHNAGYGTPEHLQALASLGPTKWHRRGFGPVMRCYAAQKPEPRPLSFFDETWGHAV